MNSRPSSRMGSRTPSKSSLYPSISNTPVGSPRASKKRSFCHVSVRVRPVFENEGLPCIWNVSNGKVETTDQENLNRTFYFDSAFHGSDNNILYTTAVELAVKDAMEGLNATVFAYGQTASGKTFSMMGSEQQPGIIPQAVDDVFNYIKSQSDDKEFLLRVSYMEIYNEKIKDLLDPEQKDLKIHENRTKMVYVSPLREEIVTNARQVMKIISAGEANRHTSSTDYNEESSRSHTIFQLTIEGSVKSSSGPVAVNVSQLNLIDLAGSERATSDLERRKEGSYINKSLLTLGTVISKLTDGESGHIPFRDSKLTRLLRPALIGRSRISVIATISPTIKNLDESLNTLKFAARVKRIQPKPEIESQIGDKALLKQYRIEIEELRLQLNESFMLLEKERSQGITTLTEIERNKYEEQLAESRILSTSLKERISHLTKLILTASNVTGKPILTWNGSSQNVLVNEPPPNALSDTKKPALLRTADSTPILYTEKSEKRISDPGSTRTHGLRSTVFDQTGVVSDLLQAVKKCENLTSVYSLVKQFELENPAFYTKDLHDKTKNPDQLIENDARLLQVNNELEIVVQDQNETITSLRKKLNETVDVLKFVESNHEELQKLASDQHQALAKLEQKYEGLKQEFREYRSVVQKRRPPKINTETISSLIELISTLETQNSEIYIKELNVLMAYQTAIDGVEKKQA
ncbi:P-loop containing nucleoside triphosphate hydrolase protein [Globomyces pollinis-pini]|nr:P-loop containing nucleoside triphosphate hydrolase protein [Globomyces pollinis-pini]